MPITIDPVEHEGGTRIIAQDAAGVMVEISILEWSPSKGYASVFIQATRPGRAQWVEQGHVYLDYTVLEVIPPPPPFEIDPITFPPQERG